MASETPAPAAAGDSAASVGVEHDFGFVPRFESGITGKTYDSLLDAAADNAVLSLDFQALGVFLRTGYFLANTTPFREIRRVGPAPTIVEPVARTRKAAIEEYIVLFRQAVRRRADRQTALALSGGADSRHILLELHAQRALPDYALTVAVPGRKREVEIAASLAERTGARHIVVTPDPRHAVEDELWKNPACDFLALDHGWFASTARSRDDLPWWDGIAGDVLSAGHFLYEWNSALFAAGRLDELADRLVPDRPVPYYYDQRRFPRIDAVAAVRRELERHRGAANPIGSYFMWNRTRSAVGASTFSLLRPHGQTTLAPFLDRDLWPFLSSLPADTLVDHRLHRETIAISYPQFTDIPYFEKSMKSARPEEANVARGLLFYLLTECRWNASTARAALRALRTALVPGKYRIKGFAPTVYVTQLERVLEQAAKGSTFNAEHA
jgi:asparagine synthase (glutamine-hydrolysing)